MNNSVIQFVKKNNAKVVIFDIDGTLKDLCAEHTNAVRYTLCKFGVNKFKKNIVMAINKLAMYIVKTGFIPTNHSKQDFLLKVYAMICGVKMVDFYAVYFDNYTRELCLFDGACELLATLNSEKELYFATINNQNYNLEDCGIFQERITYTDGDLKVTTYSQLIKSIGIDKSEVVIVGDNIFDDFLSAKKLGVKCFLVNRYKNRPKSAICKLVNSRYLK